MNDKPQFIHDLPQNTADKITGFLNLCADLHALLEQENEILLDKGTIVFDGTTIKKLNLLAVFEPAIKDVFTMVKSELPDNILLHGYLISIVQEVRRCLCINTTFHMHDLTRRTERIAKIQDGLMNFVDVHDEMGAAVCH